MKIKQIKAEHKLNNVKISALFGFKNGSSYRTNPKQKKNIEALIESIYPILKDRQDINKLILNFDWCAETIGDAFNIKVSIYRIKRGIILLHKIINEL